MKYKVQVGGEAFPEPLTFDVLDSVWWLKLLSGVGGITLSSNTIRLRYDLDTALDRNPFIIVHEAIHIRQAREKGIMYLPTYLWQAIKGGFKKSNIPMEQEAYSKQDKGDFIIL